jgi:methyl-accepting chemotaxis protein
MSTTRALAEQATASEQIRKAAESLSQQTSLVARGMAEQAAAATEINEAGASMRREAQQAALALAEQTRVIKEVATAAANTNKQIKKISRANTEHSAAGARVLQRLGEVRRITDRNANGMRETHGSTADLVAQARALTDMMRGHEQRRNGSRRPAAAKSSRRS